MQVPAICADNIDVAVAVDCSIEDDARAVRRPTPDEKLGSAQCRDLLNLAPIASTDPDFGLPGACETNAIRLASGENRVELSTRVDREKGLDSMRVTQ